MIAIIVENHAHRLMSDGSVESAKVETKFLDSLSRNKEDRNGVFVDDAGWKQVDPASDLQMNPGEFDGFIRKNLQTLNSIFPANRPKLPVSEKQENVATVVAPV